MAGLLLRFSGNVSALIRNQIVPKRLAGHSKWANIRHTKALKDGQKSTMFQKLGRQLRLAIAEGGSADPKMNSKLRSVLEYAKRSNMPSETIQRALKSQENQGLENGKTSILELRGPEGCLFLVVFVTNNVNGVKSKLKGIYRKYYFQDSPGLLKLNYEHKGIITAKHSSGTASLENCLEHAIEAGAEDVTQNEDGTFEFISEAGDLFLVQAQLTQLKYDILESECKYHPLARVKLSDDAVDHIAELCDKLMAEPEVLDIVDNIE